MTQEQVFLAALDLPDRSNRTAYLNEACGQNSELRRQVEGLLAAHERSGQFLDQPAAEQMAAGAQSPKDETLALNAEGGDAMADKKKTNPSPSDDDADDLQFLSPSTRPDSLGRLGHYEMLQVLGRGGFGIVFRAFDDMLQRVVAVKVMAPQIATLSPARKRFVREARSSAAIRHDNVVHVYEVGEQPLPYLVMEFIPGETLQQKLDRNGPLDVAEILRIGRQIAEGLAAAHACDLIHRDIKPGNILLEGGSHKAKITDFGLARAADDASISQSGIIAGTPMFMAPEQALGHKIDQRADLFSLGSVLYQMASGRPPFRAPSALAVLKRVAEEPPRPIQEIIPETPDWLCGIIAKLHAKNPEDRFQSAREVADLLADCEAKLKAKKEVKNILPAAKRDEGRGARGGRKWFVVLLLPVIALVVTVFALAVAVFVGVPLLFWGQPVRHDTGPVLVEVVKQEPPPLADGWVQLFNGKDLTGWKTHDLAPGNWRIEDGAIVGRGDKSFLSFLFSESEYADFHLRVEAKINAIGDSGVIFRAPFDVRLWDGGTKIRLDGGYEAQIAVRSNYRIHTGSLLWDEPPFIQEGPPFTQQGPLMPHRPDEWFVLEVIAQGNRIQTFVNGKKTADYVDEQRRYDRGHLALQTWGGNITFVQFRKIEIKELPPSPPAMDGFVHLFNGKDLTGWKTHTDLPGAWRFENGAITCSGGNTALFHEREFENFQLRVEAKINRDGLAGVDFRCSFDKWEKTWFGKAPVGWAAGICAVSPKGFHTGTLHGFGDSIKNEHMVHKPDEWFAMEVRAVGNQIRITVGDKTVVNHVDTLSRPTRGYVALQHLIPSTSVHFRKIEIKELPPTSLPPTYKNSIGMEFAIVPKGKSWLGGGKDKLGDKEVVMPADFYLGKYEVTQEEWTQVMGENPSWFSRAGEHKDSVKDIPDADLKRFPVENVSWDDCQLFVAKLNKSEKETGWVYRLPKEAEWEYACRGGPMADKADSAFDFYFAKPTNNLLPAQANFGEELKRTCKVGSYEPNRLGLFDLHGNVWEWCDELFDPNNQAAGRVVRGGSCIDAGPDCRAAHLSGLAQTHRGANVGFRLARVPSGAPSPEAKTPRAVGPFTDADVQRIAALPAAEQVEEVRKELMRRNPVFDGKMETKIEDGVVTELRIVTDQVTDIAPIRVFNALRVLVCDGTYANGQLADLTPLQGMNLAGLTRLDLTNTKVTDAGMVCFKECKNLTELSVMRTQVGDAGLAHFKDCKALTHLYLAGTKVSDVGLAHLKDCKNLAYLNLGHTRVGDAGLAHFKDCKGLNRLYLGGTKVSDAGLAHFKDCKNLTHMFLDHTQVGDAGLAQLKGMPVRTLAIDHTGITDLSPLQGLPLEAIRLTPKNITRGLDILRDMKSLKTIGIVTTHDWPAAEFWERYDKGEFTK